MSCAGLDITRQRRAELVVREVDRRKDELLEMLAHELRTPLAPIRTALDIQRLAPHDIERWAHARDEMSWQLTQIVQLVDDLMDVARCTDAGLQLRPRQTDLGALLETAIEATSELVRRARHTLTCELPAAMPAVFVDPINYMRNVG